MTLKSGPLEIFMRYRSHEQAPRKIGPSTLPPSGACRVHLAIGGYPGVRVSPISKTPLYTTQMQDRPKGLPESNRQLPGLHGSIFQPIPTVTAQTRSTVSSQKLYLPSPLTGINSEGGEGGDCRRGRLLGGENGTFQ